MSANDPLTSNINALISLANLATGEVDTNLSDAVHTLIDGYGQGGEESNVVVGTFVGTTEGTAMDVDIPYTGNGYPVSVIIYPSASAESVFDSTIRQYAVAFYSSVKNGLSQSPAYSGGTDDKAKVLYRSKSSSSNASAMSDSSGITAPIYDNIAATGATNNVVKINSATKLSVYIIGTTGRGFLANTEYTYIVVYSEPNGSGVSSWTKVCEKTYENISTTSTSAIMVEEWNTGHPEIWTSDKIVCVIATDTAGKRNGYFYQSYTFFYNQLVYNDSFLTDLSSCHHLSLSYNNDVYNATLSSNAVIYGLSADKIYSTGNIRIMEKYNTTGSRTVDGNYKVEVFLLDTPSGLPLFGSDTNTGGDSGGGDSGNSGLILTWYDPEVVV